MMNRNVTIFTGEVGHYHIIKQFKIEHSKKIMSSLKIPEEQKNTITKMLDSELEADTDLGIEIIKYFLENNNEEN